MNTHEKINIRSWASSLRIMKSLLPYKPDSNDSNFLQIYKQNEKPFFKLN